MSKKASSRKTSTKTSKSKTGRRTAARSGRVAGKSASKDKVKGLPKGKAAPAGAKGRGATGRSSRSRSRSASTSSSQMRDRALAHARFAHGMINKFAEGFSPEQVVAQAGPCPNHLLWTLGHLASSASWTHGMITGIASIVPDGYNSLFGMGSKPVDDAALYPSFNEVRQAYETTFQRLVDAVERLDDAALMRPPEHDSGGFISDKLDALNKLAWHEGWHLGQLSDLRRGLGLPNVF